MLGDAEADTATPAPDDRRARRREATKAEIVDAAWVLVRERGLIGLSLRDLATEVGMRAPSLYQYFESKHAIYDAMFGQAAQQALEVVGAPIDSTDRREVLLAIGHRMFDFAISDPIRATLLFQRPIPDFEPSADSYAPAIRMADVVQGHLAAIGIDDPDAFDLWTAVGGGLISQQLANDPGGTRWGRLIERAVDMYLNEITATTTE